jgi:hypothetical protein
LAERAGFEPAVQLPVRMFSKHVLSASQAPLRLVFKKRVQKYTFFISGPRWGQKFPEFLSWDDCPDGWSAFLDNYLREHVGPGPFTGHPQIMNKVYRKKFLRCLIFFALTGGLGLRGQADEIDLLAALAQRQVQVRATGTGGYQGPVLRLAVKGLAPGKLTVRVAAGLVFNSLNDWEQDLVVTQTVVLTVLPQKEAGTPLLAMCIQPGHASPGQGANFAPARMAEGGLLKLVRHIAERGYQNSTAQSAVWAVAGDGALGDLYGSDPIMVKELCGLVSEATGRPCTEQNYRPRAHSLTSVRTSLEVLLPAPTSAATLGLYTSDGRLLRTYHAGLALPPGFHQFKVGVYHTLGDSARVLLRLLDHGQLLAEKAVTVRDSIRPLQKLPETHVTYQLDRDVVGRAGIYNAAGQLYILLQDSVRLAKGFHRSDFGQATEVPPGQSYFFRLSTGDRVLAQQEVLVGRAEQAKFAPLTKRGTFGFRLAEAVKDGKVAVYGPEGEVVWVVYEQVSLAPGPKQLAYVFQHRRGRGAEFRLRLTSPDGRVLAEQLVKQL